MDGPAQMVQSQQARSKEELVSLLAERLARKKALNNSVYVDATTVESKTEDNKSKGLMLCGPLNKPPAAFFDEARDEVTAAVHDMLARYGSNNSSAAGSNTTYGNARANGDESARDGVEHQSTDDENENDAKQDAQNWISIAAARNPDFASLLACGPSPRSKSNSNSNSCHPAGAAAPAAAHRRSTSSVSYASSSTDSTLSSLQAPDMLDELEWWLPGFDKDRFRTLVDELRQDEDQEEEEVVMVEDNGSSAGGEISLLTEDFTASVNEEGRVVQCVYNKVRALSIAEESLTDVFEGLECESTLDQDDDTSNKDGAHGTLSLAESATNTGSNNTFDSAVGCAPTEEMDNTVSIDQDQERADVTGTAGHGSTLAYYERVVQASATGDGSGHGGPSNDARQTTEITESYTPVRGFAIECKFEQPCMPPQDTHETAVGAAPEAADDVVHWDQDQREEEEKSAAKEEKETAADPKHKCVPGSLRRFNPSRSSNKSVASSLSKIKTKLGKKKKKKKKSNHHTSKAVAEPEGSNLFHELNA